MRALLISANSCIDPYPVYPLGMGIIAQVLTNHGIEVTQRDILVHKIDNIEKTLRENNFDLIGVSIRNIDTVNSTAGDCTLVGSAFDIVKLCKSLSDAPVVLGGSGFTLYPEEIMKISGADYGIAGEGEGAVAKLLEMIADGAKTPAIIRSESPEQQPALYDEEILEYYYRKTHIVSIQTKRGCPFNCVYCTYPHLEGRVIRERNIETVCAQIAEYRAKYPDALFFFVDSIFNDRNGEYKHFLKAMTEKCGKVPFSCFITPEALTEEDIDLLHKAGLVLADVGIDATSDATLRGMGKNFSFEHALKCVKYMQKLDIGLSCSVMVGGPGETAETLEEGIANLHKIAPAIVGVFSGVRIIAGTPLYDLACRKGMVPADWNGLSPLYFFENDLDRNAVHERLAAEFKDDRHILYPPDRMNKMLRTIHKIGYLQFREYLRGSEQ